MLASIFAHAGGYGTPETFNAALVPAIRVGATVVAAGSAVALLIPRKRRAAEQEVLEALAEAA